jgi:hypothetical protein
MILLYISAAIILSWPQREFWIFFISAFSVLIVPSVFDLIWGVWDFPVENLEKLSVSTLNKLGFVNDVEGLLVLRGAKA